MGAWAVSGQRSPPVPERARLCAAPALCPEEPLLQEATVALVSGNAVTIGYGTSERAADRLQDPYALVLHRRPHVSACVVPYR